MDTKWKNRKNAISIIIFVIGVSLTLGGMVGILKDKPDDVRFWQVDKLLRREYQQNYQFQDYITGRFWNFLAMAVGDSFEKSWRYGTDDYYYGNYAGDDTWNYDWELYQDNLDEMLDTYQMMEGEWEALYQGGAYEEAEEFFEEMELYREKIERFQSEMGIYQDYGLKALTKEEKKKNVY